MRLGRGAGVRFEKIARRCKGGPWRTSQLGQERQTGQQDRIADLVAIVSLFTSQLYGLWRAKRKVEQIETKLH